MTWLVQSQDGEPTPARTTQWLVQYRSVSGETVSAAHDTREAALESLTDQLIASALQLWAIGENYPTHVPQGRRKRQEFFDRGDRFIHHVIRLMDTTDGAYMIHGKQGRRWMLLEVPAHVEATAS